MVHADEGGRQKAVSEESRSRPEAPLPIAIVIPCYRTRRWIGDVLAGLRGRVARVYVVDDACPEGTGRFVEENHADPVVTVLYREVNGGVGAAVATGYLRALEDGWTVVVKMDGDNQMDAAYLPVLVAPLLQGEADYTKGNRFFDLYALRSMPLPRIIGNAGLSFLTKIATGYWDIMDPTNGYTAIHRAALARLPLERLEKRFFFESDVLYRLSTIRAVVRDVPMPAIYGEETSNLRIGRVLREFPRMLLSRILKRFFYMYVLRDFNIATVETILGALLLLFGVVFGGVHWLDSIVTDRFASTGTVMIAVVSIVIGVQLLLSALGYDIASRPAVPLQRLYPAEAPRADGGSTARGA